MAEEPEPESESADMSSSLDMVTIFSSSNLDAEMEALEIHSILEASGIPSVVVGTSVIPSLAFQVQVPRANVQEAEKALEEAQEAGPAAAAEAEEDSEGAV